MILSQVDSLMAFYATFVLIALGTSLAGYFSLTVTLIHWFEKKRARALSLINLGFAAGGFAVPIVAWSLVTFGWRATAFTSGVIAIIVSVPCAWIIRNRPADVGETVDGERAPATRPHAAASETANQAGGSERPEGFTVREALRTRAFWLISLGHGFALIVVGAVNVHAITHMKEGLGYSIGEAALLIGLQTVAQVSGIFVGWAIGERFDKRYICAVCMFGHMTALLLFAYATVLPMLIAFAILNGAAWGLRGSFMQAIRADYFGRRAIGMIMGLSSIIVVVGHVGGPLFAGILADATGNYRLGFTILAILAGIGALFFVAARRPVLKPSQG